MLTIRKSILRAFMIFWNLIMDISKSLIKLFGTIFRKCIICCSITLSQKSQQNLFLAWYFLRFVRFVRSFVFEVNYIFSNSENAYHTAPYIKCVGKCLSYNFHTISKNGWKKISTSFCGCLILIKQSGDKYQRFSFFEKNDYHTITIYGNCMTSIFLMATQTFFQFQFFSCAYRSLRYTNFWIQAQAKFFKN